MNAAYALYRFVWSRFRRAAQFTGAVIKYCERPVPSLIVVSETGGEKSRVIIVCVSELG